MAKYTRTKPADEWVKYHLLSAVAPRDPKYIPFISGPRHWDEIVDMVGQDFSNKSFVSQIAKHLVESGQVVLSKSRCATIGDVKFEHAVPTSRRAKRAANAIMDDLLDRRGIKQALWETPPDVQQELLNSMAHAIDRAFGTTPSKGASHA